MTSFRVREGSGDREKMTKSVFVTFFGEGLGGVGVFVGRRNNILGSFKLFSVKSDYGQWIMCSNLKSASKKKSLF